VIQLKPKYAIIQIGINNTWALETQHPEEYRKPDQIEEALISDIVEMARLAREHAIVPILCSNLPTCTLIHQSVESRNSLVCRINERLQAYCSDNSLIFVDYHIGLCEADELTLRSELTYDGLHMDIFGYNTLAKILREELAKHMIEI
jgi:lysophospholipase L1-like esterase